MKIKLLCLSVVLALLCEDSVCKKKETPTDVANKWIAAVTNNDSTEQKRLMKNKFLNVNITDSTKKVDLPLIIAITPGFAKDEKERKKLVKSLLQNGADPDKKGISGKTPLDLAVMSGYEDIVQLMVYNLERRRKDIDDSLYVLFHAIDHGNINIVKYLIKHSVNINTVKVSGETALTNLITRSDKKTSEKLNLIKAMLESHRFMQNNPLKRFINAEGKDGQTPMFLAKQQQRLAKGVDAETWKAIIKVLKKAGAKES